MARRLGACDYGAWCAGKAQAGQDMATANNGKIITARRAVATARLSPMKNHDALRFHGWWGAEINDVAEARAASPCEANGHVDQEPRFFFRAVFVTNARHRVNQPTSPPNDQPTNQPANQPAH